MYLFLDLQVQTYPDCGGYPIDRYPGISQNQGSLPAAATVSTARSSVTGYNGITDIDPNRLPRSVLTPHGHMDRTYTWYYTVRSISLLDRTKIFLCVLNDLRKYVFLPTEEKT